MPTCPERRSSTTTVNILFIHGNYPAQFQSLARLTGADARHRVVFLTARADASSDPTPGVETPQFQKARDPRPETHHYLHASEEAVLNGQAVLRGVDQLLQEGFRPDLVITHAGNGLGLQIEGGAGLHHTVDEQVDPVRAGIQAAGRDLAQRVAFVQTHRLARRQAQLPAFEHLGGGAAVGATVVNGVVDDQWLGV